MIQALTKEWAVSGIASSEAKGWRLGMGGPANGWWTVLQMEWNWSKWYQRKWKEWCSPAALEQEVKGLRSHLPDMTSDSMLPPVMLGTAKSSMPPAQVTKPTWPLPQPEAGPSRLPPPQPEAGPSRLLPQPEAGPSMWPMTSNLGSHIVMEVDDDIPEWLTEEQGYKPSTGPATVSKRQHHRGLGPPVEFVAFNTV